MKEETIHKETINSFHWERFSKLHPTDVCNRTYALYNPAREGFLLPVFHLKYLILPKEKKIKLGGNEILYGERGFALVVFPKILLRISCMVAETSRQLAMPHSIGVRCLKTLRGFFKFFFRKL